jgi:hypothetical protein
MCQHYAGGCSHLPRILSMQTSSCRFVTAPFGYNVAEHRLS